AAELLRDNDDRAWVKLLLVMFIGQVSTITAARDVFFKDTAATESYTLSLHDALPISRSGLRAVPLPHGPRPQGQGHAAPSRCRRDRKSTRLNSSHRTISYAVFCLKKKTPPTTC